MKKRITVPVVLILAFLFIICITGCGKKETAAEVPTEAGVPESIPETKTQLKDTQPETAVTKETAAPAETETPEEEPAVVTIGVQAGTRTVGKTEKEQYYSIARVETPQVELTEDAAKEFPQLASALKTYNAKLQKKAEGLMARLTENYQELAQARPEDAGQLNLCDETVPYILRADSRVLSVLNYTYAYYGGAHPDHYYTGVNFDSVTGKQLTFADVITDMDAFTALVDQKIKEAYPDLTDYFFSTPAEAFALAETADANFAWNLGYEGIRLVFNPYCLGAYAMGEQTVTVSYKEAPELFVKEYTVAPESWFTPVIEGLPIPVDALGNGKPEMVSVKGTPFSEEEAAMDFSVVSGDRACRLTGYAYKTDSYLLQKDGRYYVYVFETSDNDWVTLSTVDLLTMSRDAENSPNAYLCEIRSDWTETAEGYTTESLKLALTEPDRFRLDSRMNFLGTQSAGRYYCVGKNGAPEAETTYYTYHCNNVLKVKQSFEAETVDEDGNVTGKVTLEPDTYLFFVRTDDASYADLQEVSAAQVEGVVTEWYERYSTEKKNSVDWTKPVYRIREDKSKWPFTIGGIEESEVLGGIGYAG